MTSTLPSIRVTQIGEYLRHFSCQRRFKLELNNRELARNLPFAERLFNTLDPVLQEAGARREDEWESSLKKAGLVDLTEYDSRPGHTSWDDFADQLTTLASGQPAYGREIAIAGDLGCFHLEGRIDFLVVLWEGGIPRQIAEETVGGCIVKIYTPPLETVLSEKS